MLTRIHCHRNTRTPFTLNLQAYDIAVVSVPVEGYEHRNEDACAVFVSDNDMLVAIADGAGSYIDGDLASSLALAELSRSLEKASAGNVRQHVLEGFEQAHLKLLKRRGNAATTLLVGGFFADCVRSYHCDDSGMLIVGGRGRIKQRTVPHSPTGYALEAGLMDESTALLHEERNLVNHLLGHLPLSIEVGGAVELSPRDTVVLASDGLFDNLYADEIATLACSGNIASACANLAELATERMNGSDAAMPSSSDDLTIALVRRTTR